MPLDELLTKYRNEWLLIEVQKFDEEYHVVDGNVLVHSPVKEDIYKALLRVRSENVAIEYAGEVPDDFAVMLSIRTKLSPCPVPGRDFFNRKVRREDAKTRRENPFANFASSLRSLRLKDI